MYIPSPPLLTPHIAHCSAAPRLYSCTECCHLIPQPQGCAMPPALRHTQCPLPTNQRVVPSTHSLPTKGHAQCLLPTNWSCPHLLPTNQMCPMPAAHQSKVLPHACCPQSSGRLLLTNWLCPMPAAHQLVAPNACFPPAVLPTNQKVVPNTSCPPTKTCPMLTAHQTKGWAPLLAAP